MIVRLAAIDAATPKAELRNVGLRLRYFGLEGETEALKDISFSFAPGEFVAITTGVRRAHPQKGRSSVPARPARAPARPAGAQASAALCDGLVAELNALQGGEDAALWAFRSLPDKNRLTAADAQRLEEAFQAKLAGFAAHSEDGVEIPEWAAVSPPPSVPARDGAPASSASIARPKRPPRQPKFRSRSPGIDKTILALPEAAPGSGPRPRPVCRQATLPDLRSPALRCPSSAL